MRIKLAFYNLAEFVICAFSNVMWWQLFTLCAVGIDLIVFASN